jgi:hypothetical protein
MNTDYTDQLKAQIDRFDRIQKSVGAAAFPDEIVHAYTGLCHSRQFEATLVDDPCIEATADVDPTGRIAFVSVYISEGGRRIQEIDVEPGTGLWRAMEVWLEHLRTTWSGG